MIKRELKEIVAKAAREFYEHGLTPGQDSGDVSLLDPETKLVYICPRPSETLPIPNWGVTKADDIVVMDLDGNLQEDNGILATVEAPMHLAIYKAREDVKAIVHSHGEWSSVFAITGKKIPLALAEQSLFLGGEVLCAEYGRVGSQLLADNIVKALGKDKNAALMRNHGAVAVGPNMEEAMLNAIFLEKGAKACLFGYLLGGLIEVAPDDILDPSLL